MRDQAAYVLMLGVGLETCTAIHLAEETIAPDIYLRPAEQTELYECRDRHGAIHQVRTRRHRRLDRDFPKFGPPLLQQGLMHSGNLAGCPYAIVALKNLIDAAFAALKAEPRGTLRSEVKTATQNS
jgi:aminoglycoside N3'-acetyltransferase